MPRNIYSLEKFVDRTYVFSYSYGEVAEAEEGKVQKLIRVEDQFMVTMISKYQFAIVV